MKFFIWAEEIPLADPALYAPGGDPALAQTLQKRQGELAASIGQAEERWLETQTALEAG